MCCDIQKFGSWSWPLARIINTLARMVKSKWFTIIMKGRDPQHPVNKLVLLIEREHPHPFSDDSGSQEANNCL